ncbi:MAG: glutamate racemase [Clostridia bacterium]|nr:glutamate racemase [Clostridia bacterium]
MNNDKIGIFDSGIGGVTVLKEIVKILPNEEYIYYSDSINNPYGDKKDKQIINICENILKYFIERDCKAIVIACNTASAKVTNILRKKYSNIPIVAIEPAYKMVHDFAYNKTTLVMATKGTIESEKFNKLYNKYNNNDTYLMSCRGLADIIEEGNEQKIKKYLRENLSQYIGKVQNVVLGCTHYPLVKTEIKEVLGDVEFFNGAYSLAKYLKQILEEKELLTQKQNKGNIEFIDSSKSDVKKERFFKNLEEEILL